jgi:para-aminobenzoate synthetase component 1
MISKTGKRKIQNIYLWTMTKNSAIIREQMNQLGKMKEPFVFLIDFELLEAKIFKTDNSTDILWQIPGKNNIEGNHQTGNELQKWKITAIPFHDYKKGFEIVQKYIISGDTYLLNYTAPTLIETNLSLEEIFFKSKATYKIFLKNRFVCFSPESFVKIKDGIISSYPMKGTIDAAVKNAKEKILNDSKEIAEHNTIVDLIRNDLSMVAEDVRVEKFRFLQHVRTNSKNLWQVSSKITGRLPDNFNEQLGDIMFSMLPAGSVSGAPKQKTIQIIREAENYKRGFYTGIFGIFDGKNLDSCVLIRFLENDNGQLIYKSGGGITFMSNVKPEYEEMLKKVYVPVY